MWDRPAEVARPDTGTAGAAAQLEQLLWRSNTAEAAVWRGHLLLLQLTPCQLWWSSTAEAAVWRGYFLLLQLYLTSCGVVTSCSCSLHLGSWCGYFL